MSNVQSPSRSPRVSKGLFCQPSLMVGLLLGVGHWTFAFDLLMKILVTGGSGYLGTHVRRFFGADDFSRRSGHNILSNNDLEIGG